MSSYHDDGFSIPVKVPASAHRPEVNLQVRPAGRTAYLAYMGVPADSPKAAEAEWKLVEKHLIGWDYQRGGQPVKVTREVWEGVGPAVANAAVNAILRAIEDDPVGNG